MKVYYVANQLDGCWYARCMMPLIANGWDGDKTSHRSMPISREKSVQACMASDVIVFQRPDDNNRLQAAKLLKQAGKKIVYDNDDTYNIDNQGIQTKISLEGENKIKERKQVLDEFMAMADLVTTTTEFLADEYRKISNNVVVLPNCIDEDDWSEPLRTTGDRVRIGVVGSASANGDFDGIRDVLKQLSYRKDVQLVLFGLPPKGDALIDKLYKEEHDFWLSLNIEWQPFVSMADYFDTLNELRLDIMLIPRKDNYFNRCKSNIKFLEASMCEIPVIAQGFKDGKSPYQTNNDDSFMDIVIDDSQWLDRINTLIEDKEARRILGKKAKEYVITKYNIKNYASKWKQAYEQI